jgi:hypothetical protein
MGKLKEFRPKRLSKKISRLAKELNEAVAAMYRGGINVEINIENKVLPFPVIAVRLFKEIVYEENSPTSKNPR